MEVAGTSKRTYHIEDLRCRGASDVRLAKNNGTLEDLKVITRKGATLLLETSKFLPAGK